MNRAATAPAVTPPDSPALNAAHVIVLPLVSLASETTTPRRPPWSHMVSPPTETKTARKPLPGLTPLRGLTVVSVSVPVVVSVSPPLLRSGGGETDRET